MIYPRLLFDPNTYKIFSRPGVKKEINKYIGYVIPSTLRIRPPLKDETSEFSTSNRNVSFKVTEAITTGH